MFDEYILSICDNVIYKKERIITPNDYNINSIVFLLEIRNRMKNNLYEYKNFIDQMNFSELYNNVINNQNKFKIFLA